MRDLEAIIGLEVHVQLNTESKMFCRCPNLFGEEPNSLICPVCTGLPGSLPVLNLKALRLGIRAALSLNCKISSQVIFERKNYFYPDLPKNYQISQYARPLGESGFILLATRKINIRRVHLEEDAGKLIHKQNYSLVDFNRAGVPLLEIVSEPDINSPQEAYEYLTRLKLILQYIGASSCDMEKGFLRCDANISVRARTETALGTKTELKNMNSFKAVKEALEYEIKRQTRLLEESKPVIQETLLWDDQDRKTKVMRTKEEAHDYRYFPEPDLVIFEIKEEDIDRERALIPELPGQKLERLKSQYSLSQKEAEFLISDITLSNFFESCVKFYPEPRKVYNWLSGPLKELINSGIVNKEAFSSCRENFLELIKMVNSGVITNLIAKDILPEVVNKNKNPRKIIEEKGLKQISEEKDLQLLVDEAIKENPAAVKDYTKGKVNAIMFLVGSVMRKTKGKANPNLLKEMFERRLKDAERKS